MMRIAITTPAANVTFNNIMMMIVIKMMIIVFMDISVTMANVFVSPVTMLMKINVLVLTLSIAEVLQILSKHGDAVHAPPAAARQHTAQGLPQCR